MEEKIIDIIRQIFNPDINVIINVDMQLSALPIDSIRFIKLVVSLENEFNFEFDNEKLLISEFKTIKSIVEYVEFKAQYNY